MKANSIIESAICGMVMVIVASFILALIYPLIGIFTGVYGICATAPQWWEEIYKKPFVVIPVLTAISGTIAAIIKYITLNKDRGEIDYLS